MSVGAKEQRVVNRGPFRLYWPKDVHCRVPRPLEESLLWVPQTSRGEPIVGTPDL